MLNIYDVLIEENLNKHYLINSDDASKSIEVKVSKNIDGELFLEHANKDIVNSWPLSDVFFSNLTEVNAGEKRYA